MVLAKRTWMQGGYETRRGADHTASTTFQPDGESALRRKVANALTLVRGR